MNINTRSGPLNQEKVSSKACYMLFFSALVISMGIQFVLAFANHGDADVLTFNYVWATTPIQSIFHIYDIPSLDYPPLFPVALRLLRPLLLSFPETLPRFLLMKCIPIAGTGLLGFILVKFSKRHNADNLLLVAFICFFTLLNPAIIFNASIWGQVDVLLILLLVVSFTSLFEGKPYLACLYFAVGCLTKLQFCYFAIPFVIVLFLLFPLAKALKALLACLVIGVTAWLPFILASENIMLPFDVYLGGSGKYQYLNLQALNLYGIWTIFGADSSAKILGLMNGNSINLLVLLIATLLFSFLAFKSKKEPQRIFLALGALINVIFIFSTQQHERYQIPIIGFLILAMIYSERNSDFWMLQFYTVITYINQVFAYYGGYFSEVSPRWFENIFHICAGVNLLVSVFFIIYAFHPDLLKPLGSIAKVSVSNGTGNLPTETLRPESEL